MAARHRKIANSAAISGQTALDLVRRYDLIAVEDLEVANMLRRAKPVPDPQHPGGFLPNGAAAKSRPEYQ